MEGLIERRDSGEVRWGLASLQKISPSDFFVFNHSL